MHGRSEWKGPQTVGAAVRACDEKVEEKRDMPYYISSLRRNGKQFARPCPDARASKNWAHWSPDMT
jgi:hypothetical protein